eukprot:1151473-Rhodomonas_salina.1
MEGGVRNMKAGRALTTNVTDCDRSSVLSNPNHWPLENVPKFREKVVPSLTWIVPPVNDGALFIMTNWNGKDATSYCSPVPLK